MHLVSATQLPIIQNVPTITTLYKPQKCSVYLSFKDFQFTHYKNKTPFLFRNYSNDAINYILH